jgi:hypothetical protein
MTPTVSLPEVTVVIEDLDPEPDDDPPQADRPPRDMIAAQTRAMPLAIRECFMVCFFLFAYAACCSHCLSWQNREFRPPRWLCVLLCMLMLLQTASARLAKCVAGTGRI